MATDRDWADPATFDPEPETRPGTGWTWHGPEKVVAGHAWGGNLEILSDLLMARPKTWSLDQPNSPAQSQSYAAEQREAVLRALAAYAPGTLAVFDVDLGHTDPQLVIPYGGEVRVDGRERRITVTY